MYWEAGSMRKCAFLFAVAIVVYGTALVLTAGVAERR
jgi:hypothetical protein